MNNGISGQNGQANIKDFLEKFRFYPYVCVDLCSWKFKLIIALYL